ncbi:GntR family transcriptional regulator [Streptomyces alanosinicus]|uniref:GntR family transcriptional regulator n=1 Tax=Streptomyces alanosinicus TaxID=68171 RepID=A0A918YSI7_9ACTN|nr:GntR family transcriptional regulator [Streptomyces alanosinicus]GHE12231.1 GntR family transcriptional regulator [Streptomyces alanosinicus]
MSGAVVQVDTTSPVPPYEQIRAQLAALIGSGRLPEGERLPTVRQLAADLGLAAGTVARAYRELEAASLVRTRRGAGTRAAPPPPGAERRERAELASGTRDFVAWAMSLGFGDEEVLKAVRQALREREA